jgi:uncharacterized membrane protein
METPKPPRRSLAAHLRAKMGAGLLVVVPFGITLFVLRFLFNFADGILAPYIRGAERLLFGRVYYLPGLGLVVGLLTIYGTGLLATNVFGRRLVERWDRFLARIPLVKSIYSAARQVVEVFSRKKSHASFRQAVFVDFPRPGAFSLAYVTNEVVTPSGRRYLTCFVPTIPNPTTGFALLVEESRVYPAGMTVEEAMKIIMSCGMVVPESLRAEKLQ